MEKESVICVETFIPYIVFALLLTVNQMSRFSPLWTLLEETQRHQGDQQSFHYLCS